MALGDPDDITAWQRLDQEVTSSGKLVAEDVARLARLGVRHVINLAMDDSDGALANEAELMADAGLGYTHIPVPFEAPDDTHFEAFVAACKQAARPLHVHCIANMRVSAFLYRYHRDVAGMPEAEARARMEQIWSPDSGEHPALEPWARFIAKPD
jgi:uncharacterized protein (TIGR01244 family)